MKKNKIMRLASALLVLTLMTTCAISSTFAKYITSTTGGDEARVAYWGFDNAAQTEINLFDTTYDNTVNGDENVVAPGTAKSTEFGFAYAPNAAKTINAPEVDYEFTVNATPSGNYTYLDDNPNFKWTLKSGADGATEKDYNTVNDLLKAIKDLSGSTDSTGTKTYKAGTLPAAFGSANANAKCTIGWKWAFETAQPNTTDTADAAQDARDTAMGNAADLDNVKIDITVTATQVD